MAGFGGGGSTIATLPDETKYPYRAIMYGNWDGTIPKGWGLTGSKVDWSGTDYDDNPSITRWMLDYGLSSTIGVTPYTDIDAYDPEPALDLIDNDLQSLRVFAQGLDSAALMTTYAAQAGALAGTELDVIDVDALTQTIRGMAETNVSSAVMAALNAAADADMGTLVDSAMAAFRVRQRVEHTTATGRFAAGMSDINAVNSSAFVIGLALLESQYEDRLAEYDAKFTLPMAEATFKAFVDLYLHSAESHLNAYIQNSDAERKRDLQYKAHIAQTMAGLLTTEAQSVGAIVTMSLEASKARIIAKREEQSDNIEFDTLDIFWDAEVFQRGANMLSAVNGAVVPNSGKATKAQTALSMGATGASLGLQAAGPWGAVVGGAAGALAGYIGA